jgi:hypothetical protein
MGVFDWLFGRSSRESSDAFPELPWDRQPSIYQFIQTQFQPAQKDLLEHGPVLPDEEAVAAHSRIRWAPGAKDGVSTHHRGGKETDQAKELLTLVRSYWTSPTARNKASVYTFLLDKGTVSLIDPFLESLREQTRVNHDRLYDLAKSFATGAPDREPVKFGIALLGMYGQKQDIEIFRTLGVHDEFTLFSAVALENTSEDAENELWELARLVLGWGRVHLVERLSKTSNPEIKDWLLREGYKNSVLYEYLAYPCATGGGLLAALEQDHVDDDLLLSAAEIIQALIVGGPAENIDNYDDGAIVVELFLNEMQHRGIGLIQFLTISTIRDFLLDNKRDWTASANRGWTVEKRQQMLDQCANIIQQPRWRDCVLSGLGSSDEQEFYNADRAAEVLEIDPWPFHWERAQQQPLQQGRWYGVMKNCNENRIAQVIALAESTLPLDKIATGAATELGLGQKWEAHGCLDYILQGLSRYPGCGMRLIEAGLKSPVVRNRNMTLKALSQWSKNNWPREVILILQRARKHEPDQKVAKRIDNLIEGKPLEEGIPSQ